MQKRRIGSLEVSVIGLGTNNFGLRMQEADVAPVVDAALEAGITYFDTSDNYGESEARLGKALGRRRDDVVIATKFGRPLGPDETGGASPTYVRRAVERSLRQLGTDRIDLYMLHLPDPSTPIAETLAALSDLVHEGKVREIGASNMTADQLVEAHACAATASFVALENHYNLLRRDDEADVIPTCSRLGIAYLPYFPLESGLLSGKYRRQQAPPAGSRLDAWSAEPAMAALLDDAQLARVERLASWALARGHTVLELALAWLLAKPMVASVAAGATRPEQVRSNAAAASWQLTGDEMAGVEQLAAWRRLDQPRVGT